MSTDFLLLTLVCRGNQGQMEIFIKELLINFLTFDVGSGRHSRKIRSEIFFLDSSPFGASMPS